VNCHTAAGLAVACDTGPCAPDAGQADALTDRNGDGVVTAADYLNPARLPEQATRAERAGAVSAGPMQGA